MSGIGIEFRRIYKKRSLLTTLRGLGYSMMTSLTPMLAVILVLQLLYNTLDYASTRFADRELLSVSFTYTFIFSLIANTLFSQPIARYLGDVMFVGDYEDVMPCYYTGALMTLGTAGAIGTAFMIFCIARGVESVFALLSLCCFLSMTLVFYNMSYVSAAKQLKRVALYYLGGMALAFLLAHAFSLLGMGVLMSIQLGMLLGFLLIAALQFAYLNICFPANSGNYRKVLSYFRKYWLMLLSGVLYTVGLFAHNFVYWASDLGVSVANCYIYAPVYDKASFLAMYTNILSGVIFLMLTEEHFNNRYKEYSDTVNIGRLSDITVTKNRMFRMIHYILQSCVKLQFICAVGLFLLFMVILPGLGYYGLTMDIYPCLAGGYFAVFIMYDELMFLNDLDDQRGSFLTALIFFCVTVLGSVLAKRFLPYDWQGIGLFAGAICGWSYCYFRMNWLENHFDAHVFCTGSLIPKVEEDMPDSKVYPFKDQDIQKEGIA